MFRCNNRSKICGANWPSNHFSRNTSFSNRRLFNVGRFCAVTVSAAVLFAAGLQAQSSESSEPAASNTSALPSRADTHIFGVVPNYNAVNDPSHPFEPIGIAGKYKIAAHDAFDPFSWAITGLYAGVAQWHNQYPEFGQGALGYAKRYGGAFADGSIGDFMTEAIFPIMLHQDPRYFRLGEGRAMRRIGYAMSRTLITKGDSGARQFNYSEVGGNLAAAGLSSLYYPSSNRTMSATMDKFAVNVVSDAGFNVLKEFYPDMRRKFFHK
jgi:hypothetical protein